MPKSYVKNEANVFSLSNWENAGSFSWDEEQVRAGKTKRSFRGMLSFRCLLASKPRLEEVLYIQAWSSARVLDLRDQFGSHLRIDNDGI